MIGIKARREDLNWRWLQNRRNLKKGFNRLQDIRWEICLLSGTGGTYGGRKKLIAAGLRILAWWRSGRTPKMCAVVRQFHLEWPSDHEIPETKSEGGGGNTRETGGGGCTNFLSR